MLNKVLNTRIKMTNILAIGVTLTMLVATMAVAKALIPDTSGVIHGCYKNNSGTLRVVDSPSQACAGGETALNWNQTGPQGPAGSGGVLAYGRVTISDFASGYLPILDTGHSSMVDQISYGTNYSPEEGSNLVCIKLSSSVASIFNGATISTAAGIGSPSQRSVFTKFDQDLSGACNQFTADLLVQADANPAFSGELPFSFSIY